jgi:hypothetical protein
MYDLEALTGEIITIKNISGIEIVAQLLAYDEDNDVLELSEPRIVVINGEELALIPYLFTGPASIVSIPTSQIMSLVKSHERSAEDYQKIIDVVDEYQEATSTDES